MIATHDPWSIGYGLLTPTMKLKRPWVLARFKELIDGAYADGGAVSGRAGKPRD